MNLRFRVDRLERAFPPDDEPSLTIVVAEVQCLRRWLATIGMTAREALAAERKPPAKLGLRHVTVADVVESEAAAAAWRKERYPCAD